MQDVACPNELLKLPGEHAAHLDPFWYCPAGQDINEVVGGGTVVVVGGMVVVVLVVTGTAQDVAPGAEYFPVSQGMQGGTSLNQFKCHPS